MAEKNRYVSWDIETAELLPRAEFNARSRISCAATHSPLYGFREWASDDGAGGYEKFMTTKRADTMLKYMSDAQEVGHKILTWNGMGFDFPVLASLVSPDKRKQVMQLALDSTDVMLAFVCDMGYRLSLAAAAKGSKVGGKTAGMKGDLAPLLWSGWEGDRSEDDLEVKHDRKRRVEALGFEPGSIEAQQYVLEYVVRDVVMLSEVYDEIVEHGRLRWTSKKGNPMNWFFKAVLPVHGAIRSPLPDVAWQARYGGDPTKRSDWYTWITDEYDTHSIGGRLVVTEKGEGNPASLWTPGWLCRRCKGTARGDTCTGCGAARSEGLEVG